MTGKSAQLSLHHDRLIQRPHYCGRCTDSPVNLTLHPSLTREQDPKILKLLHLRQELSPNLEGASHLFPVKNHGLGLGGADFHPSHFTLGCKLPQGMLAVLARRSWRVLPDVPSRPSQCVCVCQVCPASTPASGSNSPPDGDQLTAQPLSSPECPRHMAGGQVTRLQSRSS